MKKPATIAQMINRLNPKGPIPTPTYKQAFTHLLQVVQQADLANVKSVTIEAIRVVVDTLNQPEAPLS